MLTVEMYGYFSAFFVLSRAVLCVWHQCLAVTTITVAVLLLRCQDLMNFRHFCRQLLVDLLQHLSLKLLKKLRCRVSQWHETYRIRSRLSNATLLVGQKDPRRCNWITEYCN